MVRLVPCQRMQTSRQQKTDGQERERERERDRDITNKKRRKEGRTIGKTDYVLSTIFLLSSSLRRAPAWSRALLLASPEFAGWLVGGASAAFIASVSPQSRSCCLRFSMFWSLLRAPRASTPPPFTAARTIMVPSPILAVVGREAISLKKLMMCFWMKGRFKISSRSGRCVGLVISMSLISWRRCRLYLELIGAKRPLMIFCASPLREFASNAWLRVASSYLYGHGGE
jgi:hypothetical protein